MFSWFLFDHRLRRFQCTGDGETDKWRQGVQELDKSVTIQSRVWYVTHTARALATANFSTSDAFASSASPEIINAGGPAGMSIIVNHKIGSFRTRPVLRARA